MKLKKRCGGWHGSDCFKTKPCKVCGQLFKPNSGIHVYCSEKCKGKWKYITGEGSTDNQYKRINGNWRRYYLRLVCGVNNRRKSTIKKLSVDAILKLHSKQNGLCALSGEPLTCELRRNFKVFTNASIDRIDSSLDYELSNIQLVCSLVNTMKLDLDVNSFYWWIKKIHYYGKKKKKKTEEETSSKKV